MFRPEFCSSQSLQPAIQEALNALGYSKPFDIAHARDKVREGGGGENARAHGEPLDTEMKLCSAFDT